MSNTTKIHRSINETEFIEISEDLIFSPDLSLNEKGLLFLILSMPNDFELSKSNLHKYLPDSNYTIDKTFASLIDKGFIKSTQRKDNKGKFIGLHYEVFDSPMPKNKI